MPARISYSDQAQALLFHARAATPFPSASGELCASVPSGLDSRRILPLRSAEFRDWLTANYYSEYESAPSARAFRSVLQTLEARARYGEWPAQKIDNRLSFEGDPFAPSKVILNLANDSGQNIEISSSGWSLAPTLRHAFRQFSSTLPLPPPELASGDDPLNKFAALFRLSPANRTRILIWMAAAIRPLGPYPVLVLTGPPVSGKSLLARLLRALLDPSSVPLRRLPERDRELLPIAFQNWILAFDQVQRIPARISQALCAIASGDALEIAQPDARETAAFSVARPLILIVPKDETQSAWSPARTLAARTLQVELPALDAVLPESAVWSRFEAFRPALLGALCTAVATALQQIREVDLAHIARLPDAAVWAAAAAPALGLEVSAILQTLADPGSIWARTDPVRDALCTLVPHQSEWIGDPAALLSQLRAALPFAPLPATPRSLEQWLSRFPEIHVTRATGPRGENVLTIAKSSHRSGSAIRDASVIFEA